MSYLSIKKITSLERKQSNMSASSVQRFKILVGVIILAVSSIISSCVEVAKPYTQIPPGIWRAELSITKDANLPFNMESSYDEDGKLNIYILNAEERIKVEEISFGTTKMLKDTIVIGFPLLDTYITGEYRENIIEGTWHVNNREDYEIPFVAYHGQSHRFTTDITKPSANLTGKWAATFELETEDEYPAIGEFTQEGNNLSGTFLTETGDYRYLEGTVQGDKFSLSCFDGSHAFLFEGDISDKEILSGSFLSGSHYATNWIATRDDNAKLTDVYGLSQITTPDKKINFKLPNTDGQLISLTDDQYEGKAKLITIMGTWCPNCLDESKFIIDYIKKNPNDDLAVIALAFEKYRDKDTSLSKIKNYKDRLSIPYEILMAGYYDKAEATKELGFIDEILSYPTLLFVNKDNEVIKVHTGFNGPATSEYAAFKSSFDQLVKDITK